MNAADDSQHPPGPDPAPAVHGSLRLEILTTSPLTWRVDEVPAADVHAHVAEPAEEDEGPVRVFRAQKRSDRAPVE